MVIARQSTARTVMVGPVLDADGVAVTGGVVGDFKISKNGGAPAALNGSATLTHRHTGHYSLALTTSDLDTVGQAEICIDDTVNACPVKVITVVEEAVYDMLFAASALGYIANAPVNVAQFGGSNGTFASGRPEVNTTHAAGTAWGSGAITAASIASDAITAAKIADNAIDAGAIASDAITAAKIATGAITAAKFAAGAIDAAAIANGAIDAATFAADVDAEILSYLVDDATRIDASALNTATGTTIPAILTDTAEIGAAGAGLTAVPWNASWDAEVQSEVQDAIEANHLDHLLAATYDPASKPGAADALLNELVENDGGVARFSANALEQAPSGSGPSAADIADAVWEEAIADHSGTAGSTAEQLAAAGAAGDPWATPLPGAYGSGTAGKIVGDNLNATVSSRATQTSVDDIPTNAELATALDPLPTAAENATAVWGAGTRSLTVLDEDSTTLDLDATIRAAVGLASANLDTQIGDLPTNSELSTALGTADDAVLAAIAALNNLSSAQAQTAAAAALTAYDPPTRAELTSDINSVLSAVDAVPTTAEIWAAGTRTLTAIDEDNTTLDLDATIRGAVGMASANLDTQLGDFPTAGENADAVLDEVVEGSITLRQSVRLANAALGGKASGLDTTTATYRDLADSKDRLVATVDANGNRTAVTRDLS